MDAIAIGLRIKTIRGQETQKDFAERLGVGRTSLARYELGERPPDAEFLYKIYTTCHTEPLWLLTGITEQKTSLTPEEHVLLARFRSGSQELRDAALRVLFGVPTPSEFNQNGISGGNNQGNSTGQNNSYNAVDANKTFDISGSGNRVAYGSYNEIGKKDEK